MARRDAPAAPGFKLALLLAVWLPALLADPSQGPQTAQTDPNDGEWPALGHCMH